MSDAVIPPSSSNSSNVSAAEAAPITPVPAPAKVSWTDLGLSETVLKLVEKAGYIAPTPVQAQSIPLILAGNDVIVSSQTGSGKTASFALPTIERFQGLQGTYGLVLAPTREIAQQTHAVFETFGAPLGIRSIVLIGGIDMKLDAQALQTYPQIIVATPGRLVDHLERGNVWLDFIKVLILDEADRMLDMGFSDQLARIMQDIPETKQTMVFSATFSESVDRLIRQITRDPKRVTIGSTSTAPPKIDQRLFWVSEEEKFSELLRLLRQETGTIIVFTRSKDRASRVWRSLHGRQVYDATFIHSDCTQSHREQALADFKSGKYRILVATDVAGRGIDVDDVAHVVNYDLSFEAEDYIHRIGRTGRQGKSGVATTFATYRDRDLVRRIEHLLGKSIGGEGPPETLRSAGSSGPGGRGDRGRGGRGGRGGGGSGGNSSRNGRGASKPASRRS